ncbi:Ribose-phosphate pyrophosphokinase [Alloiococcus otitis]|uniref:Ribose-phosphate pyrophosphokinase n=1 Tax=Alloiococcus otitis ATCC 51267 TaxID=883081 RepID=K9EAP0_9LACT|nr:ribose-phosphate diphosphokinase [Alloiococcus otitis]EKU92871.1 ribose-phosphate pyrophosphokinase 1 [Alloiococcus otitis ATCC 51267]SUU80488.1 Ribose-phosphate pyrophosphokinase [Alloiococcus otitis]
MTKSQANASIKLYALSSNRPLAEKIAEDVIVELGDITVSKFSDGETRISPNESSRGSNVYIIQSTSAPTNDNLMELLITIDAMRRASAKTINVVIPYYGYARQDRKASSREPITAKLVANMISTAGADRVVTIDLHASQLQGFFDIPVDHLVGAPLLADWFLDRDLSGDDVVVVSPDHGGVTRARKLAEFLNCSIAIVDKRRPKPNVSEVMNLVGEVSGKKCILIDDMVDTAGTISSAAKALVDRGATDVYATATHPILSGPAIERIEDSPIQKMVVTDSIYLPEEKKSDKLEIVSVGELVGHAIKRIHENRPVSPLFEKQFKHMR